MSSPSLDQIDRQVLFYSQFRITQAVVVGILTLTFPLELVGFMEFLLLDKKKRREKYIFNLRVCLFLSGFFILAAATVYLVVAYSEGLDYASCSVLARVSSGLYVVAALASLSFLLMKAKLVGKFEVENRTYQRVYKGVSLGLLAMIPFGFAMAVGLSDPKLLLDGRCIVAVPDWYTWIFCVVMAMLSTALVWLFIHPIYNNLKFTGSEGKAMRRVFYKNAIISSSAVIMTFVIFIAFSTLHLLAGIREDDSLLILPMAVINFDLIVMNAASRLTTTIWLPIFVRQRLCRKDASSSSPDTGGSKLMPPPNSPTQSGARDSKQAAVGSTAQSSSPSPVVPYAAASTEPPAA